MHKRPILSALVFFTFFFSKAQSYQQLVYEYIEEWKNTAIHEMERSGIPASVSLAQGIIESNAGHSPLAADANNHFGIKCHSNWTGGTYIYDDDTENECFRKYDHADDSWKDHSDFLKNQSRYAVLFTYAPGDYKKWCYGLKACGYATNPKYPQILINCIENFKLHQFDLSGKELIAWQKSQDSLMVVTASSDTAQHLTSINISDENPNNTVVGTASVSRTFLFNDIKTTTAKEGETLYKIGLYYGISLKRMLKYNDLTAEIKLKAGDKIYIQPKRLKGDSETHLVKEGETMWTISQIHGIQLLSLYEKNMMNPGAEPAAGETINLKDQRKTKPQLSNMQPIIQTPNPQVSQNTGAYYIVKSGDTLFAISKKYNTTVAVLKANNKISGDTIYVGQKLKLH